MYREKLMKALLQVEQMYSFVDGMKQEFYRNEKALRHMLIAFMMLLAYNAEYGQLVVLAIFSQNFYNALIIVSDNYIEHNEDIHVVDNVTQGNNAFQEINTIGQTLYARDMVPPNSPEIVGLRSEPAAADTFSETDAYESVEDMQVSSIEDKIKSYINSGLDEKEVKQIINNEKHNKMVEQSQKQLERIMSVTKQDPHNLEDVEGFADFTENHIEECESVNFSASVKKHIGRKEITIETAKQLLHDEQLLIEPSNISTPVANVTI